MEPQNNGQVPNLGPADRTLVVLVIGEMHHTDHGNHMNFNVQGIETSYIPKPVLIGQPRFPALGDLLPGPHVGSLDVPGIAAMLNDCYKTLTMSMANENERLMGIIQGQMGYVAELKDRIVNLGGEIPEAGATVQLAVEQGGG